MSNDNQEVIKRDTNTALAAFDYGEDAQLGFDRTTNADYAIPFIELLQSNSPEVGQNPQKRVAGAAVGMLMNTVNNRLWDGQKGLIFVPCESVHLFVEWVPRIKGGGLAGVHQPDSAVVKAAREANGGTFGKLKLPNDNDLVETFYVYGLILNDENDRTADSFACLAFTSTKIKSYKSIMYMLRSTKVKAPLFANRLRITSKYEKNAKGEFMNLEARPIAWTEGPVTEDDVIKSLIPRNEEYNGLLTEGKKLLEMVRGGTAKVNIEKQQRATEEVTDEVF